MLVVAAAWAASVPLGAHHYFGATFDAAQAVRITGAVSRIEWTNPHAHLFVTVKEADGRMAQWVCEASPPGVLARRGLGRSALAIGDTLTVEGFRAKDGTRSLIVRRFVLADGRVIDGAGAGVVIAKKK